MESQVKQLRDLQKVIEDRLQEVEEKEKLLEFFQERREKYPSLVSLQQTNLESDLGYMRWLYYTIVRDEEREKEKLSQQRNDIFENALERITTLHREARSLRRETRHDEAQEKLHAVLGVGFCALLEAVFFTPLRINREKEEQK